MARVILFCRLCDASYGSVGELPVNCPTCKRPTRWGTSPPHSLNPIDGWHPNENDAAMLKKFKIDPA